VANQRRRGPRIDCATKTIEWLLEPPPMREVAHRCASCSSPRRRPRVYGLPAEAVFHWPPVVRVLEMAANPPRLRPGPPASGPSVRDRHATWPNSRGGGAVRRPELACARGLAQGGLPRQPAAATATSPAVVAAVIRYGRPRRPGCDPARASGDRPTSLLADGNRPPTGGGGTCCISHSCHNARGPRSGLRGQRSRSRAALRR